jgi:hypothetical protein
LELLVYLLVRQLIAIHWHSLFLYVQCYMLGCNIL